jgi:hypothetical protein
MILKQYFLTLTTKVNFLHKIKKSILNLFFIKHLNLSNKKAAFITTHAFDSINEIPYWFGVNHCLENIFLNAQSIDFQNQNQ